MSSKEKPDSLVSKFNENKDDDFHHSSSQVKAVLRKKELFSALLDDCIYSYKNKLALALIMLGSSDNLSSSILEWELAKVAYTKLRP